MNYSQNIIKECESFLFQRESQKRAELRSASRRARRSNLRRNRNLRVRPAFLSVSAQLLLFWKFLCAAFEFHLQSVSSFFRSLQFCSRFCLQTRFRNLLNFQSWQIRNLNFTRTLCFFWILHFIWEFVWIRNRISCICSRIVFDVIFFICFILRFNLSIRTTRLHSNNLRERTCSGCSAFSISRAAFEIFPLRSALVFIFIAASQSFQVLEAFSHSNPILWHLSLFICKLKIEGNLNRNLSHPFSWPWKITCFVMKKIGIKSIQVKQFVHHQQR